MNEEGNVGASLIRPGSFSGYQKKLPIILERWNFHLLQREEVSPKGLLRQKDRERKGKYLGGFKKPSRFILILRKTSSYRIDLSSYEKQLKLLVLRKTIQTQRHHVELMNYKEVL
jgi:hypothetical protein